MPLEQRETIVTKQNDDEAREEERTNLTKSKSASNRQGGDQAHKP